MVKNTNIQVVDNFTDNFRGYAALLRKIKLRVLLAQQRVIFASNEEMLRTYWDVGEMLQQSQDADGWGKKTLQRLAVDLKDHIKAEYALRDIQKPIGISDYELGHALPKDFRGSLPTIEEIEKELASDNQ